MPIPNDPVTGQPDCCIPVWDGNPERLVIDTDGLLGAQPLWVTSKVTLTNVAGPLDYTSGEYKVLASPVAGPNMTVVPVPDPSPNEFTVAGYNITSFFGLEPQLSKAALHIRDVMKYPDVVGMVEIASLDGAADAGQPRQQRCGRGESGLRCLSDSLRRRFAARRLPRQVVTRPRRIGYPGANERHVHPSHGRLPRDPRTIGRHWC